jgi:hypothetical protein
MSRGIREVVDGRDSMTVLDSTDAGALAMKEFGACGSLGRVWWRCSHYDRVSVEAIRD